MNDNLMLKIISSKDSPFEIIKNIGHGSTCEVNLVILENNY